MRAEIIQAAFRALIKSGLPALSFDAIASEAGTSRQRVRYYFSSSEELMLALCDALADAYRQILIENAARLEGSDRLGLFLDFYFDLLDGAEKPKDDQVYDALMSLATGSEKIRESLRSQYTLLGQIISHEFQLAHPALDSRACEELSYLFVCLMYGHWKMVASLGVSPAHNRITRHSLDRLIRDYVNNPHADAVYDKIWATNG